MTRVIRLTAKASQDRKRLAAFLTERNPEAAVRAVETIISAIAGLARFPFKGHEVDGDRRELTVPFGKTGYVVQYRIEAETIIIARIFHMREER